MTTTSASAQSTAAAHSAMQAGKTAVVCSSRSSSMVARLTTVTPPAAASRVSWNAAARTRASPSARGRAVRRRLHFASPPASSISAFLSAIAPMYGVSNATRHAPSAAIAPACARAMSVTLALGQAAESCWSIRSGPSVKENDVQAIPTTVQRSTGSSAAAAREMLPAAFERSATV